jgi:hypothetical protein
MTILEEANEPTAVAVPPRRVKSDGKSSAQHRADAVEPPLGGENPLGQALHIAGGGWQKTLPHARRRPRIGGAAGQ